MVLRRVSRPNEEEASFLALRMGGPGIIDTPSGKPNEAEYRHDDDYCADDIYDLTHEISFPSVKVAVPPKGATGRKPGKCHPG